MTGAASMRRRGGAQAVHRRPFAESGGRSPGDEVWSTRGLRIVRSGRPRSVVRHQIDVASRDLLLVLVHEGAVWHRQRGVAGEAVRGQVVTFVLTEPFVLRIGAQARATSVYVSQADLALRGIEPSRFAGLAWDGGDLIGPLCGLLSQVGPGAMHSPIAPYVEGAVIELVTGMLCVRQEVLALDESPEEHSRQRIINLIKLNCADPQVDVAWIAAQLGMSRRYAQRLFEGADDAIAAMLRSRRLEHVEKLLRTGPADLPIARVAALSGFRSADTCARAFRAHFGVAPAEYRARLYD